MALPHNLISRLFISGIQNGKLPQVYPTLAGDTYLTKDHIATVIASTLSEKQGQTSTFDLCSILDIDGELLDSVLTEYEQERAWTVTNDTILTKARQNSILEDIDNDVTEHGCVSIIVKAQALGIPYQFLQKLADSGIADGRIHVHGNFSSSGLLLSDNYVKDNEQRLRDILAKTTEPLSMQKVQKETDIPAAVFYDLFEHILKGEETNGFVRGRRENAVFVPNVYRDGQALMIREFVESNDCIDYQRLNSYHLYNVTPKDFLVNHFPDIQLLDSCAVTSNIKLIIKAEIDEALGSDHWINVTNLVSPILAPSDISMLIANITDEKNDPRLVRLGQTYVTTAEWVNKSYESLRSVLERKALGVRKTKADENGIQKKQKAKRGRQLSQEQDELAEDELLEGLLKHTDVKTDPEFATLVVEHLMPRVKRDYANMIVSVYLPTTQYGNEKRLHAQRFEELLAEFRCRFQLFLKATAVFEDPSIQSNLSKHLLRTLGDELVDMILTYRAYIDQRKSFVSALDQDKDVPWNIHLDDTQREELLKGMSAEDRMDAEKARSIAVAGKPSDELINLVNRLVAIGGADSNTTMQLEPKCARYINSHLVQQLNNTDSDNAANAPLILHLTVLICFQAVYNLPLHASGKFVPKIIRQLTPRLRSDDRSEEAITIESCQQAILRALGANNVYTDEELVLIRSTKALGVRLGKEKE
ncbi:hypothetical protein INT44_009005 [Umbelopsis vinacea]|uniref:Uncharacterized protein n=1 Tax=Umbelopsis vinacea TaxID=44442 RepID=A0A8H7Q2U4_9FUNG|nr:hypothetical protein INT44_009005 [Umbelopsis vinacea]